MENFAPRLNFIPASWDEKRSDYKRISTRGENFSARDELNIENETSVNIKNKARK